MEIVGNDRLCNTQIQTHKYTQKLHGHQRITWQQVDVDICHMTTRLKVEKSQWPVVNGKAVRLMARMVLAWETGHRPNTILTLKHVDHILQYHLMMGLSYALLQDDPQCVNGLPIQLRSSRSRQSLRDEKRKILDCHGMIRAHSCMWVFRL